MARLLRPGRAITVALALIFVASGAAAPAQTASHNGNSLTLDSIAPPDVMAYATVAGLANASAAAEQLSLYRLWQEPEVQQFMNGLVEAYSETAARLPAEHVERWNAWKAMFSGRISVAVSGLTVVWCRDGGQVFPVPVPGVVMAVDLGEHKQAFRQVADGWLESGEFRRTMRGWTRSHETYRGQDILVLKTDRRSLPRLCVTATYLENLLLVGLNRSLVRQCIDRHQDGGRVLRDLPALKRARAHAEAHPLVEVFVNVQDVAGRIRGLVPDEWLEAIHDLGLDSLRAFYYASAVHDGDSFDTCYLDAPAPRRGLLAAMSGSMNGDSLKLVPRDAVFAKVARFDFGRVADAVWKAMVRVLPEREMDQVKRGLAWWEKRARLSVRKDILAALGQEWITYIDLSDGDIVPEVAVAVDVAEPEAMRRVIHTALGHARVNTREVPFAGHTLTVLQLPGEASLQPALAMVGKRLWISLTAAGLKSVIRKAAHPGACLEDSDNFREAFHGMPVKTLIGFRYIDTKRLVGYAYNLAEHFLPGLDHGDHLPVDFARMPSQEVVLRHLNSCAGVLVEDDDGLLVKQRSIGLATIYALAARLVDRAPGIPHVVVEQMVRRLRGAARHAVRYGYRDSGIKTRTAKAPAAAAGVSSSVRAVNPLKPGDAQEAKLRKALGELTRAMARKPNDPALHYRRGQVLHQLRRFDLAAADFQLAFQGKVRPSVSAYNAACCLSLARRKDKALNWLEVAFENGFESWDLVNKDSDLADIRSDPRFKALVARFRRL